MSRADLLDTLRAHVEAKSPHLLHDGEPTPRGCVVVLGLDLLCASQALGPFEIESLGIVVQDVGKAPARGRG